jgi:cell division protein ZipA
MSALQWALLIFGVVAVVAIYFYSRRDHRSGEVFGPEPETQSTRSSPSPFERQMDIFSTTGQFDDLGVGRARRIEPGIGGEEEVEDDSSAPLRMSPRIANFQPEDDEAGDAGPEFQTEIRPEKRAGIGARTDSRTEAKPGQRIPPVVTPSARTPTPDRLIPDRLSQERGAAAHHAAHPPQEKLISLLIAEREGAHILGDDLHAALREQGLEYGLRQVYHRLVDGQPVFSVASLLKPGILDPAQSRGFATPGLAVFMVLPGPVPPLEAFQDMLRTAQSLAGALNAEVYDNRKKPLTSAAILVLRSDVDAWAQTQGR